MCILSSWSDYLCPVIAVITDVSLKESFMRTISVGEVIRENKAREEYNSHNFRHFVLSGDHASKSLLL